MIRLFHKDKSVCINFCLCRFKVLGILDDNEMVDVALRKLIFLFLIRTSDYGVGAGAYLHEYT